MLDFFGLLLYNILIDWRNGENIEIEITGLENRLTE